ncbi:MULTISPECIES: thiamine ABC transporter ATP-binding protein ThiQ [Enterobacterales]|uniref:thiamine ABC transporter ATP-binding protein ThiQ n=1 Tax=Enterobacterales TaxID=91347 RepID=UPI0008480261|nr:MULTISPECIES: thiamine ABC transporter ATP-binding protein ThiQ [Enterobacterales]WOO49146.1 thiamine ABC transporter ATP-binding protein ThiQ [Hafnia alvei]MCK9780701.1 thiamine ABC transporter ATP-binding protein ThiQ [Proteus columbae]MCT6515995.1 thiamine ABC transporter ATP-binding protein ThiQ [Proteus vulgaris]ODQ07829.1 thiamine ABC transporter ATP-binding protein [Shigella sp. FC130]OEI95335.1 thiamine ABC transporter ATP-binding protein [Shigella sp. FC1655]
MIKLEQLAYTYEHQHLLFNLTVNAGERIAVLGPSGAGKSTLLSLIAGFLPSEQGSLFLNGQDHTKTVPAKRPISMLFQDNNLFPHLTVRQNIGLGLNPGLKLTGTQKALLESRAEQVALSEYLERLPSQLSGGQRQRVAIARCLVREQPILLLDEPFSALDPALRIEMLALLEQLCREKALTLLMVSHSLEDAAKIASRAIVIDNGMIVYDGNTQSLINGEVDQSLILGIPFN